jgi:membrane protease YdiL (CAAX protease family)
LLIFYAFVSAILALLIFTVFLYWRSAKTVGLALPSGLESFRLIEVGIGLACFSGGIRILAICAVSSLAPDRLGPWFFGGEPNELIVFRQHPIEAILLKGVLVVLLVPLLEELFFRGWAFRRWNRSWGFLPAALASSALFAAIHSDTMLIGAFVFGLVACKLYQESGNLLSPLLVHFTLNLISMFTSISFLLGRASNIHDATELYWDLLPAGIGAIAVGGGISMWILKRPHRSASAANGPPATPPGL